MRYLFILLAVSAIALAGARVGGRVGYFDGGDPRTGMSASTAMYGGQISFPLLSLVVLEVSGTYAGTESDITLQNYLVNYIEEEYDYNFAGDTAGLSQYLEDEWGWSPDSIQSEMLGEYTATFHDIDLAATLKVMIPIGALPVRPYIGGGGGAHILFSDADVLMQVVAEETGGNLNIDPYDHVHPGVHGVIGASFEPPAVPVSFFAEYRYTKPISSDTEVDGISQYSAGVNLGF